MLLVRRLVISIAGRKHHAFHTEFHHVVEKLTHALRIGALKKRSIRGDAEAALKSKANSLHCLVIGSLAADRKVVVLALAIHVDRKRKIFAGSELVEAFAQ